MGDAEGPVVEDEAPIVADGQLEIDDVPPTASGDHTIRYSLAWWLSFAVPISIAMVAIMGAIVGFTAEDHASMSSAYDNDAQVSSTYLSGHNYNALLTGQAVATSHNLWEELSEASGGHTPQSMVSAAEPACANVSVGTDSLPAAHATVNCQLAQVFSGYAFPGYWEHGNPVTFDTQRYVQDVMAIANLGRDVAVRHHSAQADDQRHRELRLLWLGILLALALAFCTLAQAALHHRWTKRTLRTSLLLAIPGWILLTGCSTLLLAWEV